MNNLRSILKIQVPGFDFGNSDSESLGKDPGVGMGPRNLHISKHSMCFQGRWSGPLERKPSLAQVFSDFTALMGLVKMQPDLVCLG